MLAVVLTLGAMPVYGTFASAGTDEPTVETTDETPTSSVEPTTPEPAPAPQGEPEATPAPSQEPEASPTSGATPTESPEPENTTYANSISGVLWTDANEDGIYDSGEQPLAGYPVYLYAEGDTDNAVDTATTDADGKYLFEDIQPGRYVVGIKAEENGTEYLLPLMGVQNDNKFYFTPDYSKVISNAIDIAADTVVTDINAAMRTMPQIQPMADYTIDMSTVSAAGVGYTYASNELTFTTAANNHTYTISGTTTTKRIVVNTGVTANITLNGVTISSTVSPIRLLGTASVDLTLSGTNTLTCTGSGAVGTYLSGLHVSPSATLKISGSGALTAIAGGFANAGIGGSYLDAGGLGNNNNAAGTIIINSGTVTATGGNMAAGIGGGEFGSGGTITINGGTVNATGSTSGAGIGGGVRGTGGTITINGGTVTATNSSITTFSGAGIGGGYEANGGTIIINGGTVTATIATTATDAGAGIGGGGYGGGAGNITITGGTVTATGGSASAARDIGYGNNGSSSSGSIVFTGGSIYPTRGTSYVSPTPTNGSTYGAPDTVGMLTFPQFAGQEFTINTAGSLGPYTYTGVAHTAAAYPWLVYPGIITDPATNVAANSATLNGTYYMNGTTISSAYFEYGTSTGYGSTKTLTTPTNTTSGNIDSVSDNLTGLTSNTTYHYRLVITVGSITVPGNDMTFTTKPVVDTLTAVPTGSSTATISGTIVTGNASISDVIITYATDAGFTANVVTLDGSSGVAFTNTTYTANITGLTSGQTYYVKVEAVGLGGTSDAKTGSFLAGGNPVTEKFVNLSGSAVDSTGLPDNTVIVTGSYTASGIPTSHTVSGDTYTYIGYKLDSYTAGDTLTSGTPSSVTITGSRDVYYVYAIAEGSIKIEKYAHDGTTLLPGAEFKLEKLLSSGGAVDTSFTPVTLAATSGTATFDGLPAGIYRMTETKAPTGYELLTAAFEVDIPKDITYAVGTPPADSSYLYSTTSGSNVVYHYYDVTYKVSDQASIAMPSAGATGTFPPYALWGGGLILLAALGGGILWTKRRRTYAPKHG